MFETTLFTETENASRYLQQLAKHWSHRFEVMFDTRSAHITFSDGKSVTLEAVAKGLQLVTLCPDEADSKDLESVVIEHVKRFAFKEDLVFDHVDGDSI